MNLPVQERSPSAADHLALRFLIKYLSQMLGVGYKTVADGTGFTESTVKNYVNDKSTTSKAAAEMYAGFAKRCAALIMERPQPGPFHDYAVHLLVHLYGSEWLKSARIAASASMQAEPPPDVIFANWLGITDDNIAHAESRFRGLWRVVRPSSPVASHRDMSEVREVNYSLLNIRPRSVNSGKLCDFRWYYLGQGREKDEYDVFEGFVIPNVNRIEFLGRALDGYALLTLMVWRFRPNREILGHVRVASGQALSLNTFGAPVSARVRAFFVEQSDQLSGRKFDTLKNDEVDAIGVAPLDSLRARVPADQHDKTVHYLSDRPIVGFFSGQDDTSEG
ncbi:MAG: hypothetical protein KGJ49_05005 [Alphaproteobacteria bacterium]|nr:hypothetical protein [Alphaproteobacteria bacterium]